MSRLARIVLVLLPALAACDVAGGEGAAPAPDGYGAQDAREVRYLEDAVLLEQAAPDAAPSWEDAEAPADAAAPEAGAVAADAFVTPEVLPDAKGPLPLDAFTNAEGVWSGKHACGPDGAPCPPGQACLDLDGDGQSACEPIADCSPQGAVDLKQLMLALLTQGKFYVKLTAKVRLGEASCSMVPCTDDDPCCNQCFARLWAGDDHFQVTLLGNGMPIGCMGTECDFAGGCAAAGAGCDMTGLCGGLQPGMYYWLWGEVDLMGGKAQLLVDGFCVATPEA